MWKYWLTDASRLRDHRIVDGSKLHLSVKQETTVGNIEDPNEFNTQLRIFLKRHLNTQDTEKVMAKFKEQFKTWISSLSLDDIERLATIHMKEASSYWCNVITVNSRPRNFGISAKFVVPKQPLIPFDLPLLKKRKGLGNGIRAQFSAGFSIQKGKKMSWHCCLLPLSFALMSV